jgi:hypothetical protein
MVFWYRAIGFSSAGSKILALVRSLHDDSESGSYSNRSSTTFTTRRTPLPFSVGFGVPASDPSPKNEGESSARVLYQWTVNIGTSSVRCNKQLSSFANAERSDTNFKNISTGDIQLEESSLPVTDMDELEDMSRMSVESKDRNNRRRSVQKSICSRGYELGEA